MRKIIIISILSTVAFASKPTVLTSESLEIVAFNNLPPLTVIEALSSFCENMRSLGLGSHFLSKECEISDLENQIRTGFEGTTKVIFLTFLKKNLVSALQIQSNQPNKFFISGISYVEVEQFIELSQVIFSYISSKFGENVQVGLSKIVSQLTGQNSQYFIEEKTSSNAETTFRYAQLSNLFFKPVSYMSERESEIFLETVFPNNTFKILTTHLLKWFDPWMLAYLPPISLFYFIGRLCLNTKPELSHQQRKRNIRELEKRRGIGVSMLKYLKKIYEENQRRLDGNRKIFEDNKKLSDPKKLTKLVPLTTIVPDRPYTPPPPPAPRVSFGSAHTTTLPLTRALPLIVTTQEDPTEEEEANRLMRQINDEIYDTGDLNLRDISALRTILNRMIHMGENPVLQGRILAFLERVAQIQVEELFTYRRNAQEHIEYQRRQVLVVREERIWREILENFEQHEAPPPPAAAAAPMPAENREPPVEGLRFIQNRRFLIIREGVLQHIEERHRAARAHQDVPSAFSQEILDQEGGLRALFTQAIQAADFQDIQSNRDNSRMMRLIHFDRAIGSVFSNQQNRVIRTAWLRIVYDINTMEIITAYPVLEPRH